MRTSSLLLAAVLALGCGRGRAQSPCAGGSPGFTAYPAACTNDGCRACAAHLGALWSRRSDRAARGAFRLTFMRASADARDAFCAAHHPDGTYPFEHCTAGLAPGASCATYSPYCVDVITGALRSGDTPMSWRAQLDVAVGKSCDRSRDELVARLRACPAFDDAQSCESPACNACLASHLAALTVLAPVIDNPDRLEQLIALVDATPEVLARAAVETLGAPDPPADIESTVAQRAVRHHCLSLTRRSAAAPPFACNAILARLLGGPEFADHARAWTALAAARPSVRAALLDVYLAGVTRPLSPEAATNLRALPATELADALRRALARSPVEPAVYASLRAELARAAPGAPLPPETPPAPASSPPPTAPTPPGGGLARPVGPPSREG